MLLTWKLGNTRHPSSTFDWNNLQVQLGLGGGFPLFPVQVMGRSSLFEGSIDLILEDPNEFSWQFSKDHASITPPVVTPPISVDLLLRNTHWIIKVWRARPITRLRSQLNTLRRNYPPLAGKAEPSASFFPSFKAFRNRKNCQFGFPVLSHFTFYVYEFRPDFVVWLFSASKDGKQTDRNSGA